jgi:pimeloyl-ACP methyl ester carboxylesterase
MRRVLGFIVWTLVWLLALAVLLLLAFRIWAALREMEPVARPAEGRMIETSLGAVYVEEAGAAEAPAVLLVHGSVGWARMWQPTQAALAAAGYRAIAFDLAPMGFSERDPTGDYSRARQGERIQALAAAMGIRPVLVAHSFGAGAAAEAAMASPEDFAGLVVIDGAVALGAGPQDLPSVLAPLRLRELLVAASVTNPLASAALLKQFLYRKEVVTDEMIAMLQQPMNQPGSTVTLARWLPFLLVPPGDAASVTEAGWRGLALPVAFIWGDRDSVTPLGQGQALAALTDAPLFVLPEVGHIPQIEDPAGFHAALLDALAATGTP